MFFHQYKYRIKYFLKTPTILFWALIFPILLGTLFNATFGSSLEGQEGFATIPAAVVIETESAENTAFLEVTKTVAYNENKLMFDIIETSLEEASKLLADDKISVIMEAGTDVELIIKENGFNQSIAKSFLDQYTRTKAILTDIALNSPEQLQSAALEVLNTHDYVNRVSVNGKDTSAVLQYFYALLAMVCMFGCYLGLNNAKDIQANLSAIAARRCITPSNKLVLILADNLAALTIHMSELMIVWAYLRLILNVPIGDQPLFFALTLLLGSITGISMGQFVGVVSHGSENAKNGLLTSISMAFSFFSGLMYAQMKDIVEKNFPLLNRINPAALVTDCFYCLSVFNDYTRYFQSLILLAIIATLLTLGSFLFMRRVRYESI